MNEEGTNERTSQKVLETFLLKKGLID